MVQGTGYRVQGTGVASLIIIIDNGEARLGSSEGLERVKNRELRGSTASLGWSQLRRLDLGRSELWRLNLGRSELRIL